MTQRIRVTAEDLDRAAQVARKLEHAPALAALAYDLVSRQAEGRSVLSGQAFVAERAEAHGVERGQADTPYGNLLTILENGADSSTKLALLSALYVKGFARAHEAAPSPAESATEPDEERERQAMLERFIAHCDWLELCSPYRVQPLLPRLLSDAQADAVARALEAAVMRDDAQDNDAQTRAKNAARISALETLDREAARRALATIADQAADGYARALAGAARAPRESRAASLDIAGRWGRFPLRLPLALLSWLSGWALLSWLGRALLWAVGFRRSARVSLDSTSLTLERESQLWGRAVRSSSQVHPLEQLRAARRASRFPLLHSLVGVVSLGLGVLLGGIFLFDGLRVGELSLLAIGGALLLGGAGLDLVLAVLLPGGRSRVALDLDLGPGHRARISGVPQAQADALLEALARAFPPR